MLSTYYNGEVYDIEGDRISVKLEKNRFSSGTLVLVNGWLSTKLVNSVSFLAITIAILLSFLLQFYYKTGSWTVVLYILGAISGFYYSKPPLRWVQRGIGELLIAYNYGWLPVAAGYYLQAGSIKPLVHWMSLPIACSAFNVILMNEFPDYPADIQTNKRNLVVRFGKRKAAFVYATVAITGIAMFFASLSKGLPIVLCLFYIPIAVSSLAVALMMLKGEFNDRILLERMCLITLLVNLGTCLVYIAGMFI